MGKAKKIEESKKIKESDLRGFKYFRKLLPVLDRLHDDATARDKAHNRILHFDQYVALQLLFFFNPIVNSLRGLVQASHLKKVQRELGVSPTSVGSFSEAGGVFDAELLKGDHRRVGQSVEAVAWRRPAGRLAGEADGGGRHGTPRRWRSWPEG
jgi:hypothetical protein